VINSVSPILLFLIAGNLLSWRVGIASGLLAAGSHHLSYYSNLILSDSLCPLPILIALYLVARAGFRRPGSLWLYGLAGLMIGASAWIRPNPMLLGLFCALVLLFGSAQPRRFVLSALVLASVSIVTVVPITIRNYIMYREFVPIQIGVGLNLWEGLADVSEGRFGARTDDEVILQEIAFYDDPRYGSSWASPDGIKRDRDRMRKSLDIISAHPFWYLGTMVGRMGGMLKDTADAPLVFRSTDTKLRDALSTSRANQTRREQYARSDPQIETIDRSALGLIPAHQARAPRRPDVENG
jgi:4-amino-4-deoxy-L-arabinose transferase-like glycosyltransferase